MKLRQVVSLLALLLLSACAVLPASAELNSTQDPATQYYNLAESAISEGRLETAVQFFDMALAENTTLIGSGDALMYVYKDKAAALSDLGRYDEALKTVNAGLVLYKNSTGMWNNKGYILYKMGKYDDAVNAYSQAVTLDPKYLKGWLNKGNTLNAAGRYQEAVAAFNNALAIDPGNADGTAGLAAAQKGAASSFPVTTIALAAIVIIAAVLAVWYVKFRKPDAGDRAEKKGSTEKKNKK